MPLQGEHAGIPTYIDMRSIDDGSNEIVHCEHRVLGGRCVQKTVAIRAGSEAFAEPRLLEQLDHPKIPPVREAQFDPQRDNCITFVMPWYPGGSVARALVDGHQFSVHEAVSIIRDVLDALEYLHTVHGYVHRDLKTSNVLLDEELRVGFLTDFERAARVETDYSAQAVLTTVFYMAPECGPTGRHSIRSDIYGVGLVLFELLNGRFSWESFDQAATEERVIAGHRAMPDRMLAPRAFDPSVPNDLVRIVRKAVGKDPESRYLSARAMIMALNRVRCIDWKRHEGAGLVGTWVGSWPPNLRPSQRNRYRVSANVLQSGAERGRLRLVAETQRPASITWRRFAVPDATVDPDDAAAVRQFFSDVAARAAHLRPAR